MNRREFLTATGAGLSVIGGCVADGPRPTRQADPSDDPRAHSSPELEARGPTRGQSDVEIEVREVEDDDDVEYIEEDHAVRFVAGWRHTNHEEVQAGEPPEREPFYDTTPFERWGEMECLTAAGRAASEHANETLDTDEVGSGVTTTVEGEDLAAVVSVQTILDRDGDVVSGTAVEFDALVAATPASVESTYRLDDQAYRLEAPVYARYDVLQQD